MGETNADGGNTDEGEKSENANGDEGGSGSNDKGGNADQGGENQNEADDGEAPAVRDKKDFIIQRLKEKNAKLANKDKNKDDDQDDDADDIPEEDERVINRVIQKNFGDVLSKTEEQQDKSELNEFMGANPDFKKFEQKIWRFWQDPSRRHLPVSSIAYEVAGKSLLKIGADRAMKANDKAKENSNAGSSGGGNAGKKPVSEMSVAEFMEYKEQVKRR